MSDTIDAYRDLKEHHRQVRAKFGTPCPVCVEKLPRAHPKILLPQQVCRMHGYRDPRPALTQQDFDAL